ncbi:hypothetical protein F4810DRAFT_706870 [Camillea tinctor]|nr:hypothetical protein F4810DRAFT_706870 [Camillea tinctor]
MTGGSPWGLGACIDSTSSNAVGLGAIGMSTESRESGARLGGDWAQVSLLFGVGIVILTGIRIG